MTKLGKLFTKLCTIQNVRKLKTQQKY